MKYTAFFLCLIIIAAGCQKSYKPPSIAAPGSYLVVEGTINSGPGKTTIMLSKTVNLSSSNAVNPVLNASIMIESDRGANYPVPEDGKGKYISANLTLDITAKYRLHIKTADNHEYLSDFVPVTNSPPVDNVSFDV